MSENDNYYEPDAEKDLVLTSAAKSLGFPPRLSFDNLIEMWRSGNVSVALVNWIYSKDDGTIRCGLISYCEIISIRTNYIRLKDSKGDCIHTLYRESPAFQMWPSNLYYHQSVHFAPSCQKI